MNGLTPKEQNDLEWVLRRNRYISVYDSARLIRALYIQILKLQSRRITENDVLELDNDFFEKKITFKEYVEGLNKLIND